MALDCSMLEKLKLLSKDGFPRLLGIDVFHLARGEAESKMTISEKLLAPNGYLHAGSIVTLADTTCGFGCLASLRDEAHSFTTIELKSNHLSTAAEGVIVCKAKAAHLGGTTHVWDAIVSHSETNKTLALFRCTQLILK